MRESAVVALLLVCTLATGTARAGQPPPAEEAEDLVEESPVAQPQAPLPPQPRRTGFRALVETTAGDFAAFPRRTSTWVILAAGAGSALLAHSVDEDLNDRLAGSAAAADFFAAGRWIGSSYAQVGAAAGLYLVGRYVLPRAEGEPKTNKVSHLGFDLVRAQLVSQGIVHAIKIAVRRDRPTGECCSFPSGHAASAFAAAAVLERHLGYRAAWPTLVMASYVGVSRLHDNRHFLSDVVFGAAVGTASGWTVVGRHGRSDYSLIPVPIRGGVALTLVRSASTRNRD